MTINEKLKKFRSLMKDKNIDAYIIRPSDYHLSEYIGEYFNEIKYISGFSGTDASMVITDKKSALWVDGRFYIQAENELKNTEIEMMKASSKGTKTLFEYIKENIKKGGRIAFDGRTVSCDFYNRLTEYFANLDISFETAYDLVGEIWQDRPQLSNEKAYILPIEYTGESVESKLFRIREKLSQVDAYVVTALDEICWTLNIRGNDIEYSPLVLSYMIIEKNEVLLFVNKDKFKKEDIKELEKNGVKFMPYNDVYKYISSLKNAKIAFDTKEVNMLIRNSINNTSKFVLLDSPIAIFKAQKNKTELENFKKAHLYDGIALCKFIYWLKHNIGKKEISELSAMEKLNELREKNYSFVENSFAPIIAYGENGAIVHYETSETNNKKMQNKSFCLCDTGGHYIYGTTDVTRTIALGELTNEEKKYYTLMLKGNLNYGSAVFRENQNTDSIDHLARQALFENGANYLHSTSHGIGYLLNVHEGPRAYLAEGVVRSNEPAYYEKGKFGVRLENTIAVQFKEETEYGKFYNFETLTLVPFEPEAIDTKLMNDGEIEILNNYHKRVFDEISPFLTKKEMSWLKKVTKKIKK